MKMKIRCVCAVLLSLFVMTACGGELWLGATTLARLNLDQLAQAADVVARVRCTESAGYLESGTIWTRTQFTLIEPLKGSPPPQITVRLPGGRSGHIVVSIEAVPRFRAGEEGVLFLEKLSAGDYSITGWALGAFRILRNERTGEETVTQDSSALTVFDQTSRRFVTEGIRQLPLREFRRRLAASFRASPREAGKL